jgi:hypothetical protein
MATDLKEILEERILSARITFSLHEALGIAKRDFHELMIDTIKKKRQAIAENLAPTLGDEEGDMGKALSHAAADEIFEQIKREMGSTSEVGTVLSQCAVAKICEQVKEESDNSREVEGLANHSVEKQGCKHSKEGSDNQNGSKK